MDARKRLRSAETRPSEEDGAHTATKKKKISGLYKPPTHSELQSLKETQDLFRSNLMKLQITELLSEVKPRSESSSRQQLDALLHSLKEALTSLAQSERVNLCDGLSLLPKTVRYPLRLELAGVKGQFQFLPPAGVTVVGGYLLGTLAKPDLNVELALSIPETCVQAKDRLKYRYFHKRALYLSVVAGHLKTQRKSLGISSLHFTAAHGNPLLPVLVLTPASKQLSKYRVSLLTTLPDGFFPVLPLSSSGTPRCYNALRWESGARERLLREVYAATQDCPALADAVLLCKVWSRQRQLDRGYGCVQELHFAMLAVALLRLKKINGLMSSYQLLRIMLQHLATNDWTVKGLSLANDTDPTLPSLQSFHAAFDVVFLDSTGLLNLCGEMSGDRFHWLSHEAAIALGLLDDPTTNGFQQLFMKPHPPELKFDVLCHVSPRSVFEESGSALDEKDSLVWPLPLHVKRVWPALCRGLGKRVKLIAQLPFPRVEWKVSHRSPDPNDGHLTLGLLLDTEHAFSIIDMGPPADNTEAAEDFRAFWGAKSELRRFQDGSINEAVVWVDSEGGVARKRGVCELVVKHLLQRHAGITPDHVTSTAAALGGLLTQPGSDSGEEESAKVQQVFTALSRDLRALADLPLSITSVQGASPVFSHTEVFPAKPWSGKISLKLRSASDDHQSDCLYPSHDRSTPSFTPALEVVCQLESSGRWADDLCAIGKMKTAFYLYIAKAASDQRGLLCSPTEQFLDIFKSGFVFRLRIHCHQELSLLSEAITTATPGRELAALKQRRADLQRETVYLPVHTSTMHGLQQQYPAFAPGVRLCKRWVSAHLLSPRCHLSEEAVELMVAHLFLRPASGGGVAPGFHTVVLLRFLSLLATHDWASEPLVVDPNNELSQAVVSDITAKLTSNRSSYPSFFIATPLHRDSAPWTTPLPPIAARLQLLAGECLAYLSLHLALPQGAHLDLKVVFREPLDDYDALIHLDKKHVPRSAQAVDATPTSCHTHGTKHAHNTMPVVNFDPVQLYLQELEEAFSEFAFFFYDQYGGSFIAVVWKPDAFAPQPFKVLHAHCRVVADSNRGRLVPDVQALLAAFTLVGRGLVRTVELLHNTS